MALIYEPSGKAREYSPLALNIYMGCTHRCEYCYAPDLRRRTRDDYFCAPYPRKDIVENLGYELAHHKFDKQVLLSFIGDCYCESRDNGEAVRGCLELLLEHHVPVAILTKGGERCLRDLDLFKKFGQAIQIGATLTFDNDKDSLEWEGGAALPEERLAVLEELHRNGIKTFASFEPVIVPSQSLNMMERGLDCIDTYKVGKINHFRRIEESIDWRAFTADALSLLRWAKKDIYIKDDLAKAAGPMEYIGTERDADAHTVRWE